MKTPDKMTAGFSLVEVTLALGLAGFCLTAIYGLLPVALNSNRTSIEQTGATGILSAVVTDLRATPSGSPGTTAVSGQFAIPIPANPAAGSAPTTLYFSGDGQFSAEPTPGSRYRITVTFQENGGGNAPTYASVKASWPAQAVKASGSVEVFVAMDRN